MPHTQYHPHIVPTQEPDDEEPDVPTDDFHDGLVAPEISDDEEHDRLIDPED